MARRFAPSWPLMLALCILAGAQSAAGQESQGSPGGVRFLLAAWSPPREVDATTAPVLMRRVSLDLTGATLREALREITRQADLEIVYSLRVVPLDNPVSLHARDLTVAAALTEILAGVSVDVSVTVGGGLALVPREPRASAIAQAGRGAADSGTVSGQVTERTSGAPIAGATVTIDGTGHSAATGADGRYRIGAVPPGTYLVRARYIGYTSASTQVTVEAGQEVTVDLALERSAQELNQLVVTGTFVPTEVKALPTPVTIIQEEDIALQRPRTVQELFRSAVPGAVGWDYSSSPYNTQFSVRGASSLSTTTTSMKVFVDGVEATNAGYTQVDPSSIARIEVIRGPQAAAIYGSEAIGGVIQIFTKRGDAELGHPEVSAEAAAGVVQTPYTEAESAFRQDYKASVRGGESGVGYYLGAGYSRVGDWLPNGETSRQASPSVYGGVNFARGIIGVDISARYYANHTGNNLVNPEVLQTGFVPLSKPSYQPIENRNQTVGARLSLVPASWWRSTVSLGIDNMSYEVVQSRPRLTTPADTLLLVASRSETKRSIGLSSSLQTALSPAMSGVITAGMDYWSRPVDEWAAFNAVSTTGTIETSDGGFIYAARSVTTNTGYFAQAQLGLHDALFFTAGLRGERNSDFGDSLGTPVLPRVGFAYVRPAGRATLKFRGSWGRAIRAPSPGQKLGFVAGTYQQLPNPLLGPERQQGWDAGIDATFGGRGSLSVTYYDQTAENLADVVVLPTTPVPSQQFQNVGRVKNTGVEVEGTFSLGPLTLQGQYGYARARVDQLSPTYGGDLRVGDQPLLRPKHTAGASVTVAPLGRTTLSAGLTYVGNWTYYDVVAQFRCFAGTGPCAPGLDQRGYIVTYRGFVKVNANASRQITALVSGFVSVDNLTNNTAYEASNMLPVRGRSTTLGFRLQY